MHQLKPLPAYLKQRYHGWKATTYAENHAWYERLASEGQRPRAMVISCCDSRVHVTSIFGADQGEFFIHRNIASLVPPYELDGEHHGTSAAVEYAVTAALKRAIALCEQEADYQSREILETLLEDTEQDHAYWLEKQLGLIDKIGLPNYLQSQM